MALKQAGHFLQPRAHRAQRGFTHITSLSLTSLGERCFIDVGLEAQSGVTGLRSQKMSNSGSLRARLWLV